MRVLLLPIFSFLIACSSSAPITFYGQSIDEYVNEPSKNYDLFPASIQQRWQLISINGDLAPFGISLADHSMFIDFTAIRIGKETYQYSAKAMQGFGGEYSFDEYGNIAVLTLGSTRKAFGGDRGKLEKLFTYTVKNAEKYDIVGREMKLYSPTEVLEFVLPVPSTSR